MIDGYHFTMPDFSYMGEAHRQEAEATWPHLMDVAREDPALIQQPEHWLDVALERAGVDIGLTTTTLEICWRCLTLYNRDYGGEYVDPHDCDDLARDLQVRKRRIRKLRYQHFCDFDCLRDAVLALPPPQRKQAS